MAVRPTWKGYLKLSLVTCAVELFNATTHTDKVSFKVINKATGNTVRRQYVDGETGKPVEDEDQVKGYEVADGQFLLIEEDEIEQVQIESSHTLDLDGFIRKDDIDPIYLDSPYYLAPADEVSEEAFCAIRKAMEDKKMAAMARIVLFRRERPVVIEPCGKGMLLTTLRYEKLVRKEDEVFDGLKQVDTDEDVLDLAEHMVKRKMAKFDPSSFDDTYDAALADLIKAKKAGKKPPVAKAAPKPSNVVNLFDALKQSLAADGEGAKSGPARRPPAKSEGAASRARKPKTRSGRKRKSA